MGNKVNVNLIYNFIKSNNLTKTQFCKLCKINYATFTKILKGQYNFRINALFKIAHILQIHIHQLFI